MLAGRDDCKNWSGWGILSAFTHFLSSITVSVMCRLLDFFVVDLFNLFRSAFLSFFLVFDPLRIKNFGAMPNKYIVTIQSCGKKISILESMEIVAFFV